MNIFKRFFEMLFREPLPATLGDEDTVNRLRQASEDHKYEQDIRTMALDMHGQWVDNPNGIIIAKPVRFTYTLYDEATAKYKDCRIGEKAYELFEQLKEELKYKPQHENKKANTIGHGMLGNGVYRNYDGSGTNRSGNSNG